MFRTNRNNNTATIKRRAPSVDGLNYNSQMMMNKMMNRDGVMGNYNSYETTAENALTYEMQMEFQKFKRDLLQVVDNFEKRTQVKVFDSLKYQ